MADPLAKLEALAAQVKRKKKYKNQRLGGLDRGEHPAAAGPFRRAGPDQARALHPRDRRQHDRPGGRARDHSEGRARWLFHGLSRARGVPHDRGARARPGRAPGRTRRPQFRSGCRVNLRQFAGARRAIADAGNSWSIVTQHAPGPPWREWRQPSPCGCECSSQSACHHRAHPDL